MTAKRFTIPVTITLAVALALGVTSCTPDSKAVDPTPTVSASTPAVVEPTAAPATETPAVVEPTEAPAPELPTAYIGDEQVPVDPTLPLSETVVEAVRAVTSANTAAIAATNPPSDGMTTPEQMVAINSADANAKQISSELTEVTGRTVFVVFEGYGSIEGDFYEMLWSVTNSENIVTKVRSSSSKDSIVNGINAWIASQADPSAYEVVVS